MATDKLVDFDHVTDYISREAAYKTLTEYYHHSSGVQHTVLREALNRVPTVDARPVVRGKWVEEKYPLYVCSECGAVYQKVGYGFNFCPNCGADMRGESK